MQDPVATLQPVGPGFDSLPLQRERTAVYDIEQYSVSCTERLENTFLEITAHLQNIEMCTCL